MNTNDISAHDSGGVRDDATVQRARQVEHELKSLRDRNDQLEAGLKQAQATADKRTKEQLFEENRRTANDALREAVISALRYDNSQLLIRIDKGVVDLAEAKGRLRELSSELILAHEQEQRRIARELHDELGQEITALKMVLTRGKGSKDLADAAAVIHEAHEITGELLESVRNICSTMRPQVLDDLGLIAGLSVHLKNFGSRAGLTIEFHHSAVDEKKLSPIVQSVIFRVIQEALTNVARHAQTNSARVLFNMNPTEVEFSVIDEGCGFDASKIKERPSTGLSSIIERTLLINGKCDVSSALGKGTTVLVRIPLEA